MSTTTGTLSPVATLDLTTTGDPAWLCVSNNNSRTMYFSLRFVSGAIQNFTVEPGGNHRVHVGDGEGTCYWDFAPIPQEGSPNGFFIQEYAGNCP